MLRRELDATAKRSLADAPGWFQVLVFTLIAFVTLTTFAQCGHHLRRDDRLQQRVRDCESSRPLPPARRMRLRR